MTHHLLVEDLLSAAERCLDGQSVSLRDPGALASACVQTSMTAFGEDAYPTLALKTAALLRSIVRNHALSDGNKRLGWTAVLLFLQLNGYDIRVNADVAEAFVLDVTTGQLDVEAAGQVIAQYMR